MILWAKERIGGGDLKHVSLELLKIMGSITKREIGFNLEEVDSMA